jgi:hypothetical protein
MVAARIIDDVCPPGQRLRRLRQDRVPRGAGEHVAPWRVSVLSSALMASRISRVGDRELP